MTAPVPRCRKCARFVRWFSAGSDRARPNIRYGGRHWMLTPHRWLTLTHAVQQPLLIPDTTKVTVSRQLGQTFAGFGGSIANHARSTGRLDVFGHWTEDVDLITDDAPKMARTGNAIRPRPPMPRPARRYP
jgi:hypothetical protein